MAFQGGEPMLMGLDFFRRTLELERCYASAGQRVLNTVQTNATLIDDDWASFFKENDFLVGVSVDGPREMHDAYRVDKGGKATFDRVIRGLEALQRHGVDWNGTHDPATHRLATTEGLRVGDPGLHYLCEGYQLFFRHVDQPMKVMAGLLQQGRDATGLRDWFASSDGNRDPEEQVTG